MQSSLTLPTKMGLIKVQFIILIKMKVKIIWSNLCVNLWCGCEYWVIAISNKINFSVTSCYNYRVQYLAHRTKPLISRVRCHQLQFVGHVLHTTPGGKPAKSYGLYTLLNVDGEDSEHQYYDHYCDYFIRHRFD